MTKLPPLVSRSLLRWSHRHHEALALVAFAIVAVVLVVIAFRWPAAIVRTTDSGPEGVREARESILKLVGGLAVIAAGWIAYQRLRVARSEHVTGLFVRAVEQLGSESMDVRIGGIYSLERIARDSPREHAAVMEVLMAFVRNLPPREPAERGDRHAALRVFLRRNRSHDPSAFEPDFIGAHLEQADLMRADLTNANFTGAHLQGAMLAGAQLDGAWFAHAHLEGVQFYEAKLRNAIFINAYLTETAFHDADLTSANFHEAADLDHASFLYANLTDALFDGDRLPPTRLPEQGGAEHGHGSTGGQHERPKPDENGPTDSESGASD